MLKDLVRVPLSTLTGEELIDLDHMTAKSRNPQFLLILHLRNNHGDSLVEILQGAVDVEEVAALVFPNPDHTSSIK